MFRTHTWATAAANLIVVLVATVTPTSASAAADDKSLKDKLGEFTADLSMPSTPAATLIGLTADNVIQPRTRREFEAGISGLFNGGSKPVGVIEFVPYYIARGGKMSFENYRSNFFFRAVTKTSLGVAVGTRDVDGHAISVTGISLSSVLVDLSDPIHHRAMQRCVNDVQAGMIQRATAAKPTPGVLPRAGSTSDFTPADELTDPQSATDYTACLDKHLNTAALWNRSRVSIGVASGHGQEREGGKRDVRFGTTAWLSAQYGFEGLDVLRRASTGKGYVDCDDEDCKSRRETSKLERSAMVTLHARRTRGQSDLDMARAGDFIRTDSRLVGGRFTFGSERRALFVESSLAHHDAPDQSRRTRQHAIGASFKYGDNLWINVASGRRKTHLNGQLDSVVSMGVQYGAGPEPLVTIPK